jgi:hypothetical protein
MQILGLQNLGSKQGLRLNIGSSVVFVAWTVCMAFELPLEHWHAMIRVVRRRPIWELCLNCRRLESSLFAPKTSLCSARDVE